MQIRGIVRWFVIVACWISPITKAQTVWVSLEVARDLHAIEKWQAILQLERFEMAAELAALIEDIKVHVKENRELIRQNTKAAIQNGVTLKALATHFQNSEKGMKDVNLVKDDDDEDFGDGGTKKILLKDFIKEECHERTTGAGILCENALNKAFKSEFIKSDGEDVLSDIHCLDEDGSLSKKFQDESFDFSSNEACNLDFSKFDKSKCDPTQNECVGNMALADSWTLERENNDARKGGSSVYAKVRGGKTIHSILADMGMDVAGLEGEPATTTPNQKKKATATPVAGTTTTTTLTGTCPIKGECKANGECAPGITLSCSACTLKGNCEEFNVCSWNYAKPRCHHSGHHSGCCDDKTR